MAMLTHALWRPVPVLMLTLRQFAGGKAVRVVGALSLIPFVFAAIYAIDPSINEPRYFLSEVVFRNMFIPTLLPIVVLVLATGALGNEIEDQTLPYLTLKPMSRFRIVVEKLLATVMTAFPLILGGLVLAYLTIFRRDAGESTYLTYLWATLASAAAGIVAYAGLFLLVSLFVQRALLAGLTYSILWETLLGRFLPGLRLVSVRHYTDSIYVGMLESDYTAEVLELGDGLKDPVSVSTSLIVLGFTVLIAMLLATWRLRRFNLE